MKISFRRGGGRGEYEFAGRQGTISVNDIIDCDIDFQISPYVCIPGGCWLRRTKTQGKPRIRLDNNATHAYRWLSAFLLLRKPVRMQTFSQSEDKNINFLKKYQMANIQIDIVEKKGSYCRLRPFMLDLRQGDICEIVSIPERIDRIQSVLDGTTKLPDKIAAAVESYSMAFRQAVPHEHLEGLRDGVYKSIGEFSGNKKGPPDALSFLESLLDINTIEEFDKDKEIATSLLETKDWEDDQRSEIQVRSDYVRAWRQVAERGYKGRKFSKSVIDAYDSRCLISGSRLPKTSANNVPGVDAAHILPWAKYDMDEVSNGLCLAKTYHWAFDAGILTVTFDRQENCYVVVLDKEVEALLRKEGCDLDLFIPHIGVIPESRLPKNQSLWPKPDFLDEFNRLMKI